MLLRAAFCLCIAGAWFSERHGADANRPQATTGWQLSVQARVVEKEATRPGR